MFVFFVFLFAYILKESIMHNWAKEQVLEQHWPQTVPYFSAQTPSRMRWEPGRALGWQPDVFSQSWHCAVLPFWAERDKKNLENLASPQDIFHVTVPFQQSSTILGYIEGFRA